MTSPLTDAASAGPGLLDGPSASRVSVSRVPTFVDDVTVRLIAGLVVGVGVVALATQQWWLYGLLFVDFTLRASFGPRWSPLARAVSAWARPRVAASPRPTAFAPKRFAAAIGSVMTAAIVSLWIAHTLTVASWPLWVAGALAVVMIVLPGLEAALGFCLGCRIFVGLMRVGLIPEDVCVDCAPARQGVPGAAPGLAS